MFGARKKKKTSQLMCLTYLFDVIYACVLQRPMKMHSEVTLMYKNI